MSRNTVHRTIPIAHQAEEASIAPDNERAKRRAGGALVGRWHPQGWTRVEAGIPSERIDAIDTNEWLPGVLDHLSSRLEEDREGRSES